MMSSYRISYFILLLFLCLAPSSASNTRHGFQRHNYRRDEVNLSSSQEEPLSDEDESRLPEFVGHVPNVTVQIGRDARLPCIVQNLASYRTAWIRDEEKNILTLQRQMVTRDPRISLQEESQIDLGGGDDFREHNRIRYFVLNIRNVQFTDRGGYMCQVNTVPMKSQLGYLRVVVPPDIMDQESSNDVTVVEGANVTLKCKARGHPQPEIEWRREDGARVPLGERQSGGRTRAPVNKTEGELLEITRVTRVHSGAWLCIASNGVMPSVSRRILLNVQFAPQIWIPTEEIGAPMGSNITLDCHIEAYPLPLNYWSFGTQSESIYISGPKYEVSVKEKGYKRHLRLTIQRLERTDLGIYRCNAQNALGRQEKQVRIYESETHKQTEAKQSTKPSPSTTKGRRRRKKLKHVTSEANSNDESSKTSPETEKNNLIYQIISSFPKSNSVQRKEESTGKTSKDLSSDQTLSGKEYDSELETYDDYDGTEDDHTHSNSYLSASLPANSILVASLVMSTIHCTIRH